MQILGILVAAGIPVFYYIGFQHLCNTFATRFKNLCFFTQNTPRKNKICCGIVEKICNS